VDGTLVKTKKYEYNSFVNPLDGTGFMFYPDLVEPIIPAIKLCLYKNVKNPKFPETK
jgi:hypothetical protein